MIRGTDGIDEILSHLRGGPLAVDTETTGLPWKGELVGSINLAAHDTALFAYKGALERVIEFLSDEVKKHRELVFHEAVFDMHHLRETFGLHIPYPVHDTKLESHILDNRGVGNATHSDHHLKNLARAYIDPNAKGPEKELMAAIKAAGGKHKGDWLLAPWRLYAKYSALDAWYTLQLHLQFIEQIRAWVQPDDSPSLMRLYKNERWLTLALRDMEERGIRVNRPMLEEWRDELKIERAKNIKRLNDIAGRAINWNSHPQIRALLYGKKRERGLGLTTERLTKKSKKTGVQQLSTDKNALIRLTHPIGAELLTYRKTQYNYSTGANGILHALTDENLIHCHFTQNVDTGRMSCSDPNLQGQDRESGVRAAFIPRKGLVLRMADAMAVEMRFTAHFTGEPSLVKGFNSGHKFDPHMATAYKMYGIRKPSERQRKFSKDLNFASIFGAGEEQHTEMLMTRISAQEAYHSCLELGYRPSSAESPHRALAQQLRARYKEIFPTVGRTARQLEKIVEARGFVTTAYGRHRFLDKDEAYKAFNSRIQGSAADYTKFGMVAVYRELQLGTGELALLLQVHDEIVYESEGDPRTDRRVLELIADTNSFKVPIIADMSGSRKNWQRKEKIKL
jgi:DNA polymerase-1